MSVVKADNSMDAAPNVITGDGDFDNILNILDFPMESFEDDGFVAGWDITKSQCLGPISSNALLGPPPNPDVKVVSGPPNLSSGPPVVGPQEQKPALNLVEPSGPRSILPNKLTEAQEPIVFQTQSPVSVLESSGGSCSSGKNAVPMRGRSKRLKRASSWLSPSTYFITDKQIEEEQKTEPRKDTKEKKKKLPVPEAENVLRAPNFSAVAKRCTHCQVNKTPQWREGPLGPKTLCNACGVRYRSGRLLPEYRPAASPTFVPTLHSNSHKKVVEIRNKGKGLMAKTEEPPPSPQPEFVPMSNYLFDYIY